MDRTGNLSGARQGPDEPIPTPDARSRIQRSSADPPVGFGRTSHLLKNERSGWGSPDPLGGPITRVISTPSLQRISQAAVPTTRGSMEDARWRSGTWKVRCFPALRGASPVPGGARSARSPRTAGSSRVHWYDPRLILSRASLILSTGSVTVMRMYPSADSPNPDPGVTMTPRSIIFWVNSNDDIPQLNHT